MNAVEIGSLEKIPGNREIYLEKGAKLDDEESLTLLKVIIGF